MPSKILLKCDRFHVEHVTHETNSGKTISRDVIRHPGSVVIVPVLDGEHLCLIRNFRASVSKTLIELPAGTREPNEAPSVTAHRELIEETGYHANRLEPVTSFYAAPGILDEEMHLFVASDLVKGQPQREDGEEIENLILTRREAMEMIRDKEIRDAKTIVGLLWLESVG